MASSPRAPVKVPGSPGNNSSRCGGCFTGHACRLRASLRHCECRRRRAISVRKRPRIRSRLEASDITPILECEFVSVFSIASTPQSNPKPLDALQTEHEHAQHVRDAEAGTENEQCRHQVQPGLR